MHPGIPGLLAFRVFPGPGIPGYAGLRPAILTRSLDWISVESRIERFHLGMLRLDEVAPHLGQPVRPDSGLFGPDLEGVPGPGPGSKT